MKHLFILALLTTYPALAQSPIVLTLTRDDANVIHNLIDAGIKGGGLEAAKKLIPIDDKLTAAARAAQDIDLTEEAREKVKQADEAKAKPAPAVPPQDHAP